ncbi:MAG: serine protease [Actinobacteria bacterium]|nr:serine protease [Actinomycetota bacterium]
MTKSKVDYNCSKCPGYCCTYPRIVVTDKDIARLANHFGISEDAARLRYTRQYEFESDDPDEYVNERILKHRKDHIYKTSCMFLDPEDGTEFYKVSAEINLGNSGGPVIDESGRLIGIATAVRGAGIECDVSEECYAIGSSLGLVRPIDYAKDAILQFVR